jgi:peptidyl-prolyl cis-trans isomerase C
MKNGDPRVSTVPGRARAGGVRSWLRRPWLHFAVVGAVLFLANIWQHQRAGADATSRSRLPIVVDAAQIEKLRDAYQRQTGSPVPPGQTSLLVRAYVEDEILYREALARGFDKADQSVRWRLIAKMGFLQRSSGRPAQDLYRDALALGLDREDPVVRSLLIQKMRLLMKLGAGDDEPDDDTLRRYLAAHGADYAQPARLSFTHVFLSPARRGDRLQGDAVRLLARLQTDTASATVDLSLGDSFPLSRQYRSVTSRDVEKIFGADFATRLLELPVGVWSGPIASAQGVHLVRIDAREAGGVPALDAVRSRVRQRYLAERREQRLQAGLQRLRARYQITIESAADLPSAATHS